jgi:hypothetical protein
MVYTCLDDAAQTANHIAVPLLVLLAVAQVAMAIGLIPMVLVWGFAALGSSANCILAALVYVGFAQAIDKRASCLPSVWLRLGVWLITTLMVLQAWLSWSSENPFERYLLGLVHTVTAACCAIVAASDPGFSARPLYEQVPESLTV